MSLFCSNFYNLHTFDCQTTLCHLGGKDTILNLALLSRLEIIGAEKARI